MPPAASDIAERLRRVASAAMGLPPESGPADLTTEALVEATNKIAERIRYRLGRRVEDGRIINRSKPDVGS